MTIAFIDIKNITVTHGATPVLRDVSVALPAGQLVVCIGPNGAGKSSLLRAIAGLIRPLRGTVQICGVDVAALAPQRRAEIVTLVPQFIQLPSGFSVREVVEMARYARRPWFMGAHATDSSIVDAAMAHSDVLQFADHTADRLSGGEQQRVAVARAIAQEPQVLLLDESTAHLDLQHQAAMIRIARSMTARGVTVVAAMHDLNLAAAHADAILLLDRGNLSVYGSPRDVLQQERLEQVYQTELVCMQRPDTDIPFFVLPSSRSHATTRRTETYTVADGGV